jgi:hypothetical protein
MNCRRTPQLASRQLTPASVKAAPLLLDSPSNTTASVGHTFCLTFRVEMVQYCKVKPMEGLVEEDAGETGLVRATRRQGPGSTVLKVNGEGTCGAEEHWCQ